MISYHPPIQNQCKMNTVHMLFTWKYSGNKKGFEFPKTHSELRNISVELSFFQCFLFKPIIRKSNIDKHNSIRMQTTKGKNKWPNQDEVSSKFSKNKELKNAVPLILAVINLKNIVFIWNDNNAESVPPDTCFSPAMHFSAWILSTGWILLFALEQHPFETHFQLPFQGVERSFFPKITSQGTQTDGFTKYIVTKGFLITATVQARTSSDVISKPVCILRRTGPYYNLWWEARL